MKYVTDMPLAMSSLLHVLRAAPLAPARSYTPPGVYSAAAALRLVVLRID